jgi:hypothetical protein
MRRTFFMTFISIVFAMAGAWAQAGDIQSSEPTEPQQATPESPSDLEEALRALNKSIAEARALTNQVILKSSNVLGCDVQRRRPFSACRRGDGACELTRVTRGIDFSDCAPDDRKCEVVLKMRGCVADDVTQRRRRTPGLRRPE